MVRQQNFLGVVAPDEWAAVRAAKELKVRWSEGTGLVGDAGVKDWALKGPFAKEEIVTSKGNANALADASTDAAKAAGTRVLKASFVWPVQSHASMGPSAAVADVRADRATVWSASQGTHRYHAFIAAAAGVPADKLRVLYLDGAGCYGMNGHDDAAADAALLSKAVGKPVRVQWSREDELGWDPKGPPQVLEMRAALDAHGRIAAWEAEMWVPMATAQVPRRQPARPGRCRRGAAARPDRRPDLAERRSAVHGAQRQGVRALDQRRAAAAVEHPRAGQGGQQLRGRMLHRPPGRRSQDGPARVSPARPAQPARTGSAQALRRADQLAAAPSPAPANRGNMARGRGISYVHYKHNETYVAIAMDVEIDKSSGAIKVLQIACAHDCGLMINPDAVRNQVEGNILQTLSRTLHELTTFDRQRVTSVDWTSYKLLRFSEVPAMKIDLIQRVTSRRWARERRPQRRCRRRWPMRCSMRRASGWGRCRLRRKG